MNAATRWNRLREDLETAGFDVRVEERGVTEGSRPVFTVVRSIGIFTPDSYIHINDAWWSKNTDVWIGYRVTIEERGTSVVRGRPVTTKKRSEVVAAVLAGGSQRLAA